MSLIGSLVDSEKNNSAQMQTQIANNTMLPTMSTNFMNPNSILLSDQFPDILQHYSTENCRLILNVLAELNNPAIVNKKGALGGYSALAWMCIKNEIELIDFLIKKCKADINTKANLGETPLFICIKNCNIYTIELLIKNEADLTVRDVYNRSLIHWSAYTGRIVLFYYFSKYHSISNFNDIDQFQQNALHIASASGFADLVRYLIDQGNIDLFAQDINGNNCLHMAAKSGMARTCWLITQKNRGDCVRLINVENKQKQKPYDLIRNEKGPQFKKIRDWLRIEARTNDFIDRINIKSNNEKKSDDFIMPSKFPTQKMCSLLPANSIFKWSSYRIGYAEWLSRFVCFFVLLTLPQILNRVLFVNEISVFKGIIAYSALISIMFVLTKQKHRINHISGWENPFYLGYFLAVFIHNYTSFYTIVLQSFDVIHITDLISVLLTIFHFYSFYALMNANPGFVRENIKKKDGTAYELRDLLRTNFRENYKTTKDSVNWLTEPYLAPDQPNQYQLYFCESCQIVASTPSKHCKLCESCCSKFDHHCLFINKCVGLKNHRPFMLFVIFTLSCTIYYLINVYYYFVDFSKKLDVKNVLKNPEEKYSLFYCMFASTNQIWLTNLFLINTITVFMVSFLLYFQLKFVTLGFTSQFQTPIMFTNTSKRMTNICDALIHRLNNLYIFFFKSYESNEELYYRQLSEYNQANGNKTIALSYPRNDNTEKNQFLTNFPMINANNNNNNNTNGKSQFEIELD